MYFCVYKADYFVCFSGELLIMSSSEQKGHEKTKAGFMVWDWQIFMLIAMIYEYESQYSKLYQPHIYQHRLLGTQHLDTLHSNWQILEQLTCKAHTYRKQGYWQWGERARAAHSCC